MQKTETTDYITDMELRVRPLTLFTGHGWRFAPRRYELELRARRPCYRA
ncbi:hypothetical protein [Nonomuraea mesophila]|nr:hypothetical protein [Nonomuraea mesophila]